MQSLLLLRKDYLFHRLWYQSWLGAFLILLLAGAPALSQDLTDHPASGYKEYPGEVLPDDALSIAKGREIFSQQCATCHEVRYQLIGPALASVTTRRPLPWLVRFITNSQKVIKSGDEYAEFLYHSYNETVMPPFEFLNTEQIANILAYIDYESQRPVPPPGKSEVVTPADLKLAEKTLPPFTHFDYEPSQNRFANRFPTFFKIVMLILVGGTLVVMVYLSYQLFVGTKKGSTSTK